MTRALRIAVVGAGLFLALVSCDVLFMGVFPASLGQATARRDLSAVIGAAEAPSFRLAIARSYGFELVILYSTDPFDATKPHVIVLSPSLTVRNEYDTSTDIPFFSGSSVYAHLPDGHIVVGNFDGIASSAGLTPAGSGQLPAPTQLDGWSIVGAATMAAYTWSNFSIDATNLLTYFGYPQAWGATHTTLSRLVRAVDATHGQLWLDGVFTNPEDDQGNVSLFVFRETGSDTAYFVQMPKSPDVDVPPAAPIFGYGYPVFSKQHLDSGSIAVTLDSIVAFDGNERSWIRFTPSDPGAVKSLYIGRRNRNEKTAFSFSGGYYCVWDPDTRTLTRYEDWW